MKEIRTFTMDSPVGKLGIAVGPAGILRLELGGLPERDLARVVARHPGLAVVARPDAAVQAALARYFAGEIHAIDALPVDTGGTEFQAAVWAELRRIPAGSTKTYLELARAVGRPAAVRAVGQANGANPVAIVIPCHRVIRTGGDLGGYGGGLPVKRWLLAHERALEVAEPPLPWAGARPA